MQILSPATSAAPTSAAPTSAGWWLCPDCGAEAQLPAAETTGFVPDCPDCQAGMAPLWEWDDQRAS